MKLKSLATLAATLIASSAWAAAPADTKCGAGTCGKKENTAPAKDANCSKKENATKGTEASCSKKEAACSKKEAACSKKDASCAKK